MRVKVTARWQVLDAVKARAALSSSGDFVYKELEFALRDAVGARVTEDLLADRSTLAREIGDAVRAKAEEHGLAVRSVGILMDVAQSWLPRERSL